MGRRLCILSCLLLIVLPVFTQDYIVDIQEYGVAEGVSDRAVNAIFQDKMGFIWIGTNKGLNRFDGYSFKLWNRYGNGLRDNSVRNITQDSDGMIWIFYNREVSFGYIDILDPESGKVVPFEQKFKTQLPFGIKDLCYGYSDSPDGTIYLGTMNPSGILAYHSDTGFKFHKFSTSSIFHPVITTPQKTIWGYYHAADNLEVRQWDLVECNLEGRVLRNLGKVTPKIPSSPRYLQNNTFFYSKDSNPAATYLYSPDPVDTVSLPVWTQVMPTPQTQPVWTTLANGEVLVADYNIISIKDDKLISNLSDALPYLKKSGINTWLVDRSGKLWLCYELGFAIVDIQKNKFKKLLFNGNNEAIGISICGMTTMKDGSIVANTEGYGQWRIDGKTAQISRTTASSDFFYYGLGADDQGNLYYTEKEFEITKLTPEGKTTHFKGIKGAYTLYFYNENQQKLWIGDAGTGLSVFDLQANKLRPFEKFNGFKELSESYVFHIQNDKNGDLWVCSDKGLFQIHPDRGVLARYWPGGKGRYFLPNDFFLHSYIDKEGIFWLSTAEAGLIRWDKKAGTIKYFGRASGFSNEVIYGVIEDNYAHLWMPTDDGIIQFDKKREQVRRIYGTREGIAHREFNSSAYTRGVDGTLYFGGLNGITAFHPNDFYDSTALNHAPLVVTDCQRYESGLGKMVNITERVLKNNTITLEANNRYFTIELALLSYERVSNIKYAYKYDDDQEWTFQKDRTFHFGALPYGKNILHFAAMSSNGLLSSQKLTLVVLQLKPFYLQAWFILLMIAILAGLVLLYVRWRTSQLKTNQLILEEKIHIATDQIEAQSAKLRRMDEVKSRFFANVSHELRTPLTLVLNPITTALKRNRLENYDFTLLKLAQTEGKSLLKLINQILDITKLDSDKLEIQEAPVLLFPFLNRIVAAFESQATYLGLNFIFEYKAEKNLQLLLDAPKVETILYNLLSNAMKFTPAKGTVCLEVEDVAHSIRVSVSDTGKGIHPDDLPHIFDRFYQSNQPDVPIEGGTGIGLSLCHELANLMKGEIKAESPYPASGNTGTRMYITIPRKQIFTDMKMEDEAPSLADSDIEPGSSLSGLLPANEAVDTTRQTILVVEDNSSLRAYMELILSVRFKVKTLENGLLAWEYLRTATPENLPDLLLSDIMMPEMDGFQLLGKLKADDQFSQLPVIMLTARANIKDKLKALRIGVDDYLLKPFEEEELIARIDNLLKNYLARKEANSPAAYQDIAPDIAVPEIPKNTAEEIHWIQTLKTTILENLENNRFNLDLIAEKMGLSHRQLQRRLISATGLTPSDFLTEIRLDQARQLLEGGEYKTVKEVAKAVGYAHQAYFSTLFRIRFGKMPSDYLA